MSVYVVKSVGTEPREWSSSHGGTFLSYKVDLETEDGTLERGIEWNRKVDSQPPAVEDRIAGHLEEGKFGAKFKMDYEATKELGGSRSSGSAETSTAGVQGKGWQPESERDPERSARILRQHSQEMALRWASLIGSDPGSITRIGTLEQIFEAADAFDADVIKAGQAASQGSTSPDIANPGQAGASASSPASPPAELDLEHIGQLLNSCGITYPAARDKVANHIGFKLFSEGRAEKAIAALQDSTKRERVLATLKEECAPLPEPPVSDLPAPDMSGLGGTGPDETIPFARPEYREPFSERERWRF